MKGLRVLRALVLIVLLALCVPAAAQAHAVLTWSQPAEGAVLASSPADISLTFGGDVRIVSLVLKHDGDPDLPLPIPAAAPFAHSAQAPLPALAPGAYRVEWRTVARDMHAMSGAVTFTVTEPPAEASTR